MRPRRELAIALGLALLFGALLSVQAGRTRTGELDPRLSTYRAERNGARAWADGAKRLGHDVRPWLHPLRRLPDPGPGELLAILQPDRWLDLDDQKTIARWRKSGGSALIVGSGAWAVMQCEGWRTDTLSSGRVPGHFVHADSAYEIPQVRNKLIAFAESSYVDSTRKSDLGERLCRPSKHDQVDTLLWAPSGTPIAVRLHDAGNGDLTFVADPHLFTNEALRETTAGEFALGLLPPGPTGVLVDEFDHAYGERGSLTNAILAWSATDPFGWALWQVAAVGFLVLLIGAVRTGPLRHLRPPSRRTVLEHVRALARTLGASRGHDVAIGLLVRGLRRRLSAGGRVPNDDPRNWLLQLRAKVRAPGVRAAVDRLLQLTMPGQGADEVLAAANAVEEVWQELRP